MDVSHPDQLYLDCRELSLDRQNSFATLDAPAILFSSLYPFGHADYKKAFSAQLNQLPDSWMFYLASADVSCVPDWHCWLSHLQASLTIGFSDSRLRYRCGKSNLQHELLLKAVKGRGRLAGLRVVDATAGLMRDASLLAAAGCQVLAIERIPLLAELLKYSAEVNQIANLGIVSADSKQLLSDWHRSGEHIELTPDWQAPPDVVYLDPMYQQGMKSSAALKKEMVFLQGINSYLGWSPDGSSELDLLEAARALATKKVVVKRAPKAAPLAGVAPASTVDGKALRFDIYPV